MDTAYAQALWEMIEKGKKPKEAVHALREILVAHGRQNLMPKIAHAFRRIAEKQSQRTGIVLSIAHEKDERNAKKNVREILTAMKTEANDLTVKLDDSLIGGWRLEGREMLVDASFKKQLLTLYNRATQS